MIIFKDTEIYTLENLLEPTFIDGVDFAIISSLFRNKGIHEEINKLYEENKDSALKNLTKCGIYKDNALMYLPSEEIEIAYKTTGVFYTLLEDKSPTLLKLCLKTHRELQTSYKMTKSFNESTMNKLLDSSIQSVLSNDTNGVQFKKQEAILTALRLSKLLDIPLELSKNKSPIKIEYIAQCLLGIPAYYYDFTEGYNSIHEKNIKISIQQNKEMISEYKKAWGIKESSSYTYGYLSKIFDMTQNGFRVKNKTISKLIPDIPEPLIDVFSINKNRESLLAYIATDNTLVLSNTAYLGHSLDDIDSLKISKQTMDLIILNVLLEGEIQNLDWVISTHKIRILAKNAILFEDYYKMKSSKLGNELFNEVRIKNEELNNINKKIYDLHSQVSESNAKIFHLENVNKELKEILNKKEKELNKQEKVISKFDSNNKELEAMRAFVYESQKDENVSLTELSKEEMLGAINKKKVVIVGGHPRWVLKMKEFFKDANWLDPDSQNRSYAHFKNGEYLFVINSATNSHGVTYKLIPIIEDNEGCELIYLSNNFGIDRTIKHIYENMSK